MKPNELQIGDYFYRPDCIDKVVEIRKNGVIGLDSIFRNKGISITSDILEKNGFEYKEEWMEWWHKAEDGFGSDFQLSITEDGFSMKDIINAQINYVHQLQQIMRLCKIRKEIEL